MQEYCITDLLNLKGMLYRSKEENETHIKLMFQREDVRQPCPVCKSRMNIHSWHNHTVKDIPFRGKVLILLISKQRYKCKMCNKTVTGSLEDVEFKKQHTKRVRTFTIKNLKSRNFKTCGNDIGVSSSTIMRWFNQDISTVLPKALPKILHIDEFKGNSGTEKYLLALTNGMTHGIHDILESRKNRSFKAYLSLYKTGPEIVVIDMWRPYYNAVKKIFSEAIIVVDRFHYVRQFNWAIRDIRCRVQKNHPQGNRLKKYWKLFHKNYFKLSFKQHERLDELLSYSHDLKEIYTAKILFDSLLNVKNIEAHRIFDTLIDSLQNMNIPEAKTIYNTFENWYCEIVNSFYYNYTNGVAEGNNNKIKVTKRMAYGIRNFNNFKKLILHRAS